MPAVALAWLTSLEAGHECVGIVHFAQIPGTARALPPHVTRWRA
jgi:hypothetical protein